MTKKRTADKNIDKKIKIWAIKKEALKKASFFLYEYYSAKVLNSVFKELSLSVSQKLSAVISTSYSVSGFKPSIFWLRVLGISKK